MKITELFFGKERKELEKFNKLDLDERSIVFYSESSVLLYPYVEQIIKELEKREAALKAPAVRRVVAGRVPTAFAEAV